MPMHLTCGILLCALIVLCSILPHTVQSLKSHRLRLVPNLQKTSQAVATGFGGIPKPEIVTPAAGTNNTNIDRFLMMYTCKKCNSRNAQLISKIAYKEGIVVSTCKTCKVTHLIADNLKKLDMAEYGAKIDEYLESKGEKVQRLTITAQDLENNYIIDRDGVLTLQPKLGGQVSFLLR